MKSISPKLTCVYTVGKRGGSYDVPHVIRKHYNHKTVDSSVIEEIWPEASRSANLVLQKYTLQDICEKRDYQQQLNIMYYI